MLEPCGPGNNLSIAPQCLCLSDLSLCLNWITSLGINKKKLLYIVTLYVISTIVGFGCFKKMYLKQAWHGITIILVSDVKIDGDSMFCWL